MRNSRTGEFSTVIIAFRVNDESITMPIFIKLLVIKIVARRRSGLSRIRLISLDFLVFFASRTERSDGESEKNATSDPDAKAEPISKRIIQMIVNNIDGVNG